MTCVTSTSGTCGGAGFSLRHAERYSAGRQARMKSEVRAITTGLERSMAIFELTIV
jgi:hypothetical protein